MMQKKIVLIALPAVLLLSACAGLPGMPGMDRLTDSEVKAPRLVKPAERIVPAAPSVVYDSDPWIARPKLVQARTPEAAVPATAPAPAAAPAPISTWEISATDRSVRAVLKRWAATAGWQLSWELQVDYEVEAHTVITGTFEEAMEAVATSMKKTEMPMTMIFYKSNKVIRVVAKGEQ